MRLRLCLLECLVWACSALVCGGTPWISHDFAHIGAGGPIRTIVLVFNPYDEATSITLELFADDGSALTLNIDGSPASKVAREVAANGTLRIEITGPTETPQQGSARLESTGPVGAQVLFEILSGNKLVTQAAVESMPPATHANLFVDRRTGTNTGIAIFNPSEVSLIRIQLTLKNEAGDVVATTHIKLSPRGHDARFVNQFFSGLDDVVRGSLEILSTGAITLVTLQQTGSILGTLPVIVPITRG